MIEESLISMLRFGVDTGLVSAGEALLLAVFAGLIYLRDQQKSRDFNHALTVTERLSKAKSEAMNARMEELRDHLRGCERKYELVRLDVTVLQKEAVETKDKLLSQLMALAARKE